MHSVRESSLTRTLAERDVRPNLIRRAVRNARSWSVCTREYGSKRILYKGSYKRLVGGMDAEAARNYLFLVIRRTSARDTTPRGGGGGAAAAGAMVWAATAGLNVSAAVGRAIGTTSFAETETGTPPASPDREGGLTPPPFEALPPSSSLSLRWFLFACESPTPSPTPRPIATMRTSATTRKRGRSHQASFFLRRCWWCLLPLPRRLPPWGPVLRPLLERAWSGLAAEDE